LQQNSGAFGHASASASYVKISYAAPSNDDDGGSQIKRLLKNAYSNRKWYSLLNSL